jgi:hypothetical protein
MRDGWKERENEGRKEEENERWKEGENEGRKGEGNER